MSLEPPLVATAGLLPLLKLAEESEGETVLDEASEAGLSLLLVLLPPPPNRRLALLAIRSIRFHPDPPREGAGLCSCWWMLADAEDDIPFSTPPSPVTAVEVLLVDEGAFVPELLLWLCCSFEAVSCRWCW